MQKLNVWAFAVAWGSVFSVCAILLGWAGAVFCWDKMPLNGISPFYLGYEPSLVGGIIGGMWSFVLWTTIGVIFASIYNFFVGNR